MNVPLPTRQRLLTLWDMLRRFDPMFLARLLLWARYGGTVSGLLQGQRRVLGALDQVQDLLVSNPPEDWARLLNEARSSEPTDPEIAALSSASSVREHAEVWQFYAELSRSHDLHMIAQYCDLLAAESRNGDAVALMRKLPELALRVEHELNGIVLLRLDTTTAAYFNKEHPFGERVTDRFPKAADDLQNAARCRALEMHTAAIFHLMRATECVLREVGRILGIPGPIAGDRNWGTVLKNINNVIAARKWKKGQRQFYEGVAGLLLGVKQAWRDECMHVDAKYEEDDAERIYNAVGGFMVHLAKLPRRLR